MYWTSIGIYTAVGGGALVLGILGARFQASPRRGERH
jgi:hypothetical protein